MDKTDVVIGENILCAPFGQREQAELLQKLIGKPLTRIEVRRDGIYLEFDPHGSLAIRTLLDVNCSLAPQVQPRGQG